MNQLKLNHLENIIKPIISKHIEQKEYAFAQYILDYDDSINTCEQAMEIGTKVSDYTDFIASVVENCSDPTVINEIQEDADYIIHAMQAISIARVITLSGRNISVSSYQSYLSQYIDTIL